MNNTSADLDIWDVLIDDKPETLNKYVSLHGINSLDENNRGLLSIFILEKRFDLSIYLIETTDINLNQKDKNGYTPLHFAVQNNAYLVVKTLLLKGVNIDIPDKFGNTPLFKSVTENVDRIIIETLILNGANVNLKNNFGYSPLTFIKKRFPEFLQSSI